MEYIKTRQPAGPGSSGELNKVEYIEQSSDNYSQKASIIDSNSSHLSANNLFWLTLLIAISLLALLISRIVANK